MQRFVIAALAELFFEGRRNPQPHPVAIKGAGGQEFARALRGMGGRTVAVVLREQYGRAPDVEVRSHRKHRIGRMHPGVTPRRTARCIGGLGWPACREHGAGVDVMRNGEEVRTHLTGGRYLFAPDGVGDYG